MRQLLAASTQQLFAALRPAFRSRCCSVSTTTLQYQNSTRHDRRIVERRDGIAYRVATVDDLKAVKRLFDSSYAPNFPLHKYLQMPIDVEHMYSYIEFLLVEQLMLVAEDESTGQLVGTTSRYDVRKESKVWSTPGTDERLKMVRNSYLMDEQLKAEADVFNRFNVDKYAYLVMGIVAESHARRGIGRRLLALLVQLAESTDFRLAVGNAHSRYMARILESLGFQPVSRMAFKDFVDEETGERPFAGLDATVHKEAVLFAKLLGGDGRSGGPKTA